MEESSLLSVVLNWVPMLLLIGVWFFFMKKMGSGTFTQYQRDCFAEVQRHNAMLEKILEQMDQRIARLENRDGGKGTH